MVPIWGSVSRPLEDTDPAKGGHRVAHPLLPIRKHTKVIVVFRFFVFLPESLAGASATDLWLDTSPGT